MISLDLRELPKAELHLHFEAAMTSSSAAALADRYGEPMPSTGPFQDLSEFVVGYERARDLVGSLGDLRALAEDLGRRQREAGVVWTEVHFIPATYAGRLGPDDGLVEAVVDGLRAGAGADHAGVVLGVNRGLPVSAGEGMLELALRWAGSGVVALGLAGDEVNHPAAKFAGVFRRATAAGLPTVPHGGEAAGADQLRATVELLDATRVCHGVRAVDDPSLMQLLVDRSVCLDMAPVSNVLLHVVPDLESHPLPQLMRHGVPVTLNTDIPLFTGVGLLEEYARCAEVWDLADEEVAALARTSIERSFCPEQVRNLSSSGVVH